MATATPAQRRLAQALQSLKALQDEGRHVLRTSELGRTEREALLRAGYLRPIIKGWYMPSRPDESDGDSTAWYASASEFIARYAEARFGEQWCVSADHSVRLHAGNTALPPQLVLNAPAGQNSVIQLLAGHSLLDYRAKDFPQAADLTMAGGLRAMSLETALIRVPESFFRTYARDAQIVLSGMRDAGDLVRRLLDGGHGVVAGRLAGAMRACGRDDLADDVVGVMRTAGHAVTEVNPFADPLPVLRSARGESPYVTRARLMWEEMRAEVVAGFPEEPGLPADKRAYLAAVHDTYVRDAYHSLSIEGYHVTTELIERVASGTWNPEQNEADLKSKDAMAARGYFLARQKVEDSIRRILGGENPGRVAAQDHRVWYRELFAPSVDARLLKPSDLAGYRNHQVFIRNAAHVPPPKEAVRDMMPALFELLEAESHAGARAVLGHFIFVFTHPYMDGNGRMGRFLMNAMLASGGHPWTVIEVTRRPEYMQALNAASSGGDIGPFAKFVVSSLRHETELKAEMEKKSPGH
jgi:fido (protein-threonine AMPylation protein)